jgi:hypothetical protein
MDNTELALSFLASVGFIMTVIGALSGYRHLTLKKKAELKFIEKIRTRADVAKDIQALARQTYADNIARECAIVGVLKSVLSTLPDEDRKQITGLHQPSMIGRLNYAKKLMTQSNMALPNPPINLGLCLQNQFAEADKANWLIPEDIFGSALPAFRKTAVKRAKQINLGANIRVALVIDLNESDNQEVSVIMRMYPIGTQTHLPDNLKFTVIPKSGEPDEYLAKSHHPAFETEWFFKRGEQFSIKIQLNDVTVTEEFVI